MRIKTRLIILALIPGLVSLIAVLSTFTATKQQRYDGQGINLAGRQRMLSQKMFKEFISVAPYDKTGNTNDGLTDTANAAVHMTMSVFENTLTALRDGGRAPKQFVINDDTTYEVCPPAAGEILRQLSVVTDIWFSFSERLESALVGDEFPSSDVLDSMFQQNMKLLKEMNTAVDLMQTASETKTQTLILIQIAGFSLIVVSVVVSIMSAIRIVKPITQLTTATVLLANGKEASIPDAGRKDELGTLTRSFNEMLSRLKETIASRDNLNKDIVYQKQAEEKLKKSMDEIERFNKLMTGREERVIEMKKEVNSLLTELGKEAKYYSVLEEQENKV